VGFIKQTKEENGTISLEITYGGMDAPFGGIDTSAPEPYIDPKCFTASNGFIIADNQLCAVGFKNTGIVLENLNDAGIFLGFGSFYANGQYNNFALFYEVTEEGLLPSNVTLTYTIYVWAAGTVGNIPITSTLVVTQYSVGSPAIGASTSLYVGNWTIPNAGGGGAQSVTITITIDSTPYNIVYNSPAGGVPDTPSGLVSAIIAALNGGTQVIATVDPSSMGHIIDLVTVATGAAANATTLTIAYSTTAYGGGVTLNSGGFAGGMNATNLNFGIPISPLSWCCVGETLYLGGAGTMILQYSNASGASVFSVLTQYLGAVQLNKFNGQLIACGIVPGPGQVIQYPEMVIGWSASQDYGVWNPLDMNENVTGAGFNQIGDISDYLTGMFILNSLAVVLRAQGVDYITAQQSALVPFDFQHISLAKLGEGCQDGRLSVQYDQVGAYVGNSNVYFYANGMTPIGDKIKTQLFQALGGSTIINRAALALSQYINGEKEGLIYFLIDWVLYIVNLSNQSWMNINLAAPTAVGSNLAQLGSFPSLAFVAGQQQWNVDYDSIIAFSNAFEATCTFWQMYQGVQNVDFTAGTTETSITFPPEEVSFGRQISIQGLYVSCSGVPGQVINFSVSSIANATLVLPAGASPDVIGYYQVYFEISIFSLMDVAQITTIAPQLTVSLPLAPTGTQNPFAFVKIAMFGSYDPNQIPVG